MTANPARYEGDFVAWSGGCLFIGSGAGTIAPHAHYAIQLALGAPDGLRVQLGRRGAWAPCAGALIPSRAVHSIDVDGCDWSAVLFIEPDTAQGRALSARLQRQPEVLDAQAVGETVARLTQAWRVAADAGDVREAAQALVARLAQTQAPQPSDPRVLRAIEAVRAGTGEPLPLEAVAAGVHLSPSRFRHLFVQETGMPLRTYQLWRRLLAVWEFLMQGETVAGAAHAAGFADGAHLARTCRTMFGVAPSVMQMRGPLARRRRAPPAQSG